MMNLVSLRIITDNPKNLVEFYEAVTGVSATWSTPEFAELATPACTLAIASKRTMDLFGAGAAQTAANRSAIIEFRVEDVDQKYEELRGVIHDLVMAPSTQPWGNRSMLFRDPDGNLINFFTPVSREAVEKFNS